MTRGITTLGFVVLLAGCTVAGGYPGLGEEAAAAAGSCRDGLDNDLDGRLDCAELDCAAECVEHDEGRCANGLDDDQSGEADCEDPSCAGFCEEEDYGACRNGWDDDADGMVDAEDARCWTGRPLTLRRCAGAAPIDWSMDFEGDDDVTRFVATPEAYRSVVVPPNGESRALYLESVGGAATLAHVDEVRFGWAGVELDATVTLGTFSRHVLALVPASLVEAGQPLLAAPSELPLALVMERSLSGSAEVTAYRGAQRSSTLIDLDDPTTVLSRTLRAPLRVRARVADDGRLQVTLSSLGATVSMETEAASVETSSNLRLVWWVDGVGYLDDLALRSRGGASTCASDAPQLPPDGAVGGLTGTLEVGAHLAVARGGDVPPGPRYCALALGCENVGAQARRTLRLFRSDDGTRWQSAAAPLFLEEGAFRVGGGGLAWDPARGVFVGALLHSGVRTDAGARLATFEVDRSCDNAAALTLADTVGVQEGLPAGDDWTCLDATEEVAGVSYVVGPEGHELYVEAIEPDGTALWRYGSEDGLMWSERAAVLAGSPLLNGLGHPVLVSPVGRNDRVLLAPSAVDVVGPSLRMVLFEPTRPEQPARELFTPPLVSPSGLAGAFDRYAIASGAVLAAGSERFLLYAARGDVGAGQIAQPLSVGVGYLDAAENP